MACCYDGLRSVFSFYIQNNVLSAIYILQQLQWSRLFPLLQLLFHTKSHHALFPEKKHEETKRNIIERTKEIFSSLHYKMRADRFMCQHFVNYACKKICNRNHFYFFAFLFQRNCIGYYHLLNF